MSQQFKILEQNPSGDLISLDGSVWRYLLPKLHQVSQRFGFNRIETNPLEFTNRYPEGFSAQCANLSLDGLPGKRMNLRSHNLVSVLRAYSENRIFEQERVTKWYFLEPLFSLDKNSVVSSYEFGYVNIGDPSPVSEAHLVLSIKSLLEELGFSNVLFEINHKGCEACGAYYREILGRFLQDNQSSYCPACRQRIQTSGKTGFDQELDEIFSCVSANCRETNAGAPQILDYLDAQCNKQLTSLLESLDELEITYQLNPVLFGNAWLSQAVFRVSVPGACADDELVKIAIGGRYSRLALKMIGQEIPILSMFAPLSGVAQIVSERLSQSKPEKKADVFLINLGELAAKRSLRLFLELWKNDISVSEHFGENGIKNQFRLAEKRGCPLALIIGQKEALEGSVILRDVRSGIQEVFSYDRIVEEIRKRLQD